LTSDADFGAIRAWIAPAAVVMAMLPALKVVGTPGTAHARMVLAFEEYGHFEGIAAATGPRCLRTAT
jgi:hypothetical protein